MGYLYTFNEKFIRSKIISNFIDFTWVSKYNDVGTAIIKLPMSLELLAQFYGKNYLFYEKDDDVMVVDSIAIDTDIEKGDVLTINAYSLSIILNRRVLIEDAILKGTIDDVLYLLINSNFIAPTDKNRKVENLKYIKTENTEIQTLTVDTQYSVGTDLLTIFKELCLSLDIGFRVLINEENEITVSLYKGIDRSYDQDVVPYVIFSPEFGNLKTSKFLESYGKYKNTSYVLGSRADESLVLLEVSNSDTTYSGLDRRETFIDATSLQQEIDGVLMSDDEFNTQLYLEGLIRLYQAKITTIVEGDIETEGTWKYGIDFGIGDILQVQTKYNQTFKVQIYEFIQSISEDGEHEYPSFVVLESEVT